MRLNKPPKIKNTHTKTTKKPQKTKQTKTHTKNNNNERPNQMMKIKGKLLISNTTVTRSKIAFLKAQTHKSLRTVFITKHNM